MQRDTYLIVRISTAAKRRLRKAAARKEQSMSDYLRCAALERAARDGDKQLTGPIV